MLPLNTKRKAYAEPYLGTCQTFIIERLCGNNLKIIFSKKLCYSFHSITA